ncbi:Protein-tyrosine-phosphatase [Arboricoccus pini]|uniref:Protein-tyrosine-phosphatase n=1 Tax=Arboricoccus pini TaxID=1963835 RepID=A0A212R043_9PROT|nr:arsenate reductase ArsC [Arboricoccus pini]SNB65353.1 Protein-tyrosine-phosphatase [Arboricoccus pini]
MSDLPSSVLFACTFNSIRSPMAEAILKFLHGRQIFVDSVGVRPGELDAMAVQVLDEVGIDLSRHRPKLFSQLEDGYFDLVISLSPEAQHSAVELTRDSSCELEFWHMMDPSEVEGSREQRMAAYRLLRDQLFTRIRDRFPQQNVRIIL